MAKQEKGISVEKIEKYTKRYITQILIVAAIVVAMISSIFDFFVSSNWGILFATAGMLAGMFMGKQVETFIEKVASFSLKDRTTEIVMGAVRIIVAIFIPAVIFGMMGLMAGVAFSRYNRTHA